MSSTLCINKKAYRDYEIIEKYDAGVKLKGFEVKAIKEGRGNLKGTYIKNLKGEFYLVGFNLPLYSKATTIMGYDTVRNRKILLRKAEINSLLGKIEQQGFSLLALKLFLKGSLIKVLLGLGKGKKKYEKKRDLIAKQEKLDAARLQKNKWNPRPV